MRYCIYESRRNNATCVVDGQCAACAAYQRGDFPPHFKVPALRYDVVLWDKTYQGCALDCFDPKYLNGPPVRLSIICNDYAVYEVRKER